MQQHSKQLLALHRQIEPTPTTGPTVVFKQHTVNGKGWGGSPASFGKTTGGGASSFLADPATWVDDDRITCNMCKHMTQQRQQVTMPSDHFDKVRRENHKANQWMFDIVKIKNGWARAEYIGWQCDGGQRSYIPIDVKHRCDTYKPKQAAVEVNVKEWWE